MALHFLVMVTRAHSVPLFREQIASREVQFHLVTISREIELYLDVFTCSGLRSLCAWPVVLYHFGNSQTTRTASFCAVRKIAHNIVYRNKDFQSVGTRLKVGKLLIFSHKFLFTSP